MTISTHVLDTSIGRPAAGVAVALFKRHASSDWQQLAQSSTDTDGRIPALAAGSQLDAGAYRITFDVGEYFQKRDVESFYPVITVDFIVRDPRSHHHVPLLVSPYGYSTYRGS